jgi:hypothetical protein
MRIGSSTRLPDNPHGKRTAAEVTRWHPAKRDRRSVVKRGERDVIVGIRIPVTPVDSPARPAAPPDRQTRSPRRRTTEAASRLEDLAFHRVPIRIGAEFPLEAIGPSYHGEVASRWRYKDGSGEIGVISSVSQPFCGSCTRARLTLDGSLVTCLFATGGVDLRGPMRDGASDSELREQIAGVWKLRADRYSDERSANTDLEGHVKPSAKIEMYHIGG